MGIEFNVAAKAKVAEADPDEDVVEVPIDGKVYHARRPTTAQSALLSSSLSKGDIGEVYTLIEAMMGRDARRHVERLVWNRQIEFGDLVGGTDQNPDGGLIDMVFAEFAGRPTVPSTDSSPSRAAGGRRSTGRSPGRGSTGSTSPSTDS